MSSSPGHGEQPSATKPRDLRQDLAIAAHTTTKKRKADGASEHEPQVMQMHAELTAQQAGLRPEHERRSLLDRQAIGNATAPLPKIAQTGQPTDALHYLARKGSRTQELQAELATAQAENSTLSQQVDELKGTLQGQTNKLAVLQGERDFLASQRDQERVDMEHQLAQSEQRILKVKQNLRRSEQAKAVAETIAQTAREELASSKAEAADLALHQQQQLQQLQQDLDLAQYNLQQADQQSEAAVRKQQRRTQASSQQVARLERELADVVKEAELHNQRRVQAEDKAAALQLELDSAPATARDDSILLQNLRNELAAQSADIATARRLKEKIRNTEVLQEQLHAASTRAEMAEQRAAEADGLILQLTQLQSHQQMWDKMLQGLPDAQTPENVLRLIDSLQTQLLESAERLGQVESQCAEQAGHLEQAKGQQSEQAAALAAQKSLFEQLSSSQTRLQRRIELVTKERDSLKQVVMLYQENAGQQATTTDGASIGGSPQTAAQAAQIAQLEETIAELRIQHQQVQADLAKKETADQSQLQQLSSAIERVSKAEEHVQELEKVLEDQSKQLAVAQEKLGKGEYNKATTKVLHFKKNPEALAVEALEQKQCSTLEAENAALKGQLQKLEQQSLSAAGGHVEAGSIDTAVREAQISVLQRQVADLEKAKTRLTQVFRAQVSSFREAVYQMFGYQVDVAAEATAVKSGKAAASAVYTLKPQHADDANARFQFRMNPDQQLILVSNRYVQSQLHKEVETFIVRFKSIPAFTANYTMEQFQKQTQC
ncbi:hypothetical protein ABBQ32_001779 [Trebouxia sp. C0010 RCD-2024]